MGRVTATVLFTDLVGSTELRGRLGEEAADDLRRKHDRLLIEAVEAHSGRVVKGLGDGIMATFAGAADAVAAAVVIQQAVDRLNRTGKVPGPLAVRTGLSAGDVAFEDDDVHGTPVVEASRLCAAAGGGEILAAQVVRILAGSTGGHDYVSVGPLELKGLDQPVAAIRIDWEPAVPPSIPMPQLLTDVGRSFVGRDAELDRLGQLWKEAAAGERRVVLLAGEPGVGKTRLAAALAERVHDEGATVLAGRCDEDLGVPYQPFVEALRHFVDHIPPEDLGERLGRYGGELVRLVPDLADLVPELSAPLRSDPETERYRLFDAVAAWLVAASAEEALLLVLDDIQWATRPTLLLLRHVARAPDGKRLLVLGTYRDTELGHDHPLLEVLADLRRRGGVERLSLTGLDSSGVAAFMEQAVGHELGEDDAVLSRAIHQETEGNPFFVREVIRHLSESGALERRGGRWTSRLPVLQVLGIPESVRDVVGRRLSRLSDQANQTLRMAAVVGPEFELSVVQMAGDLDEEAVLSSTEEATQARLIIEAPDARFRFAHALVRDSLYGDLSVARRVAIHRRVAEAIETIHGTMVDDHAPALAYHWARASGAAADTEKAVSWARRAGDQALAQLAHDEATQWYGQAVEILDAAGTPAADRGRTDLVIDLGEAQRRAGDPSHRQTLLDAAALARANGDRDALARAVLANHRGFFSVAGEVDNERVVALEWALEMADAADTPVRGRLLANLAEELGFSSEHDRVRRLAGEALSMARRLDDPATLAHVLARRFTVLPTTPERREEMVELSALATRLGDPALALWARCWTCLSDLTVGDVDGFVPGLEDCRRLADELGQPILRWAAAFIQSTATLMAGHLAEAEEQSQAAFEIGKAAGTPDAFRIYGANIFWIRYDQGRLEEVLELYERATRRMTASPIVVAYLGVAYCEVGRLDDARRMLDRVARDRFDTLPANFALLYGLTIAAELCSRTGDAARAAVLQQRLAPHRGLVATAGGGATGSIDHYLGLLASVLDCLDDAGAYFASAAAVHERLGAPAWLARTRLEWARLLLTRRAHGDAERARELLGQALAAARELGLAKVERDTVVLLQECP